jgi:hypothetical protein
LLSCCDELSTQNWSGQGAQYMRLCYGEGLRMPKVQMRAWDREKYFYQKSSYAREIGDPRVIEL